MTGLATVHASAVSVDGRGVLIRGASGSGKSSLVLGLVDRDPDATRLIADDRVILAAVRDRLVAAVPLPLAGKLEIRGQGIVDVPHLSPAAIALVVDLLPAGECPRYPDAGERHADVLGVPVPRLMLPIGAADGAVRVRFALRHADGPGAA